MDSFKYYAPVALHIGRDSMRRNAAVFTGAGKRAFVITSRFAPGYRNLALEDAEGLLTEEQIAYAVYDEVEENPPAESIRRVTDRILDFAPDFILAIGGGSALDTAKAANVLIRYPREADAYEVFFHGTPAPTGARSMGLLPLIGVPTTAGSGSEVAGYAVLTRTDKQTKQRMNQLSFFTDAILDARYIEQSPQWLIDVGALDALAHGIESTLNSKSNFINRMLAGFGFQLFRQYKDRLLNQSLTETDCENMLLAASVQGMALVQVSTTLPHGMGYVLTHDKQLPHGFASCVCMGEYLKSFREAEHQRTVEEILSRCGFTDADELEEYLARIICRNVSFTATEEEIRRWTEDFCKVKERFARHPEAVSKEEVFRIYHQSLQRMNVIQG